MAFIKLPSPGSSNSLTSLSQASLPAPPPPTCHSNVRFLRALNILSHPAWVISHIPTASALTPELETPTSQFAALFPFRPPPTSRLLHISLGLPTLSATPTGFSISFQICSSPGSPSQEQPSNPQARALFCFGQLPVPSLSTLMACPLVLLPWSSPVPSYLGPHPSCLSGLLATTVIPSNPPSTQQPGRSFKNWAGPPVFKTMPRGVT